MGNARQRAPPAGRVRADWQGKDISRVAAGGKRLPPKKGRNI